MLNKNRTMYSVLISRLSLSELTALYERSKDYPMLCSAIESEIDLRIAPTVEDHLPCLTTQSKAAEMSLITAS